MKLTKSRVMALLALGLSSCWLKTIDGHTVNTSTYEPDQLRSIAAFDLQCPPQEVSLTVLSDYANDVGASGCGRQLKYVRVGATSQYVANTAAQ